MRRTERRKRNCFSAAAEAACGMILYRPRSNGKDSQSDNKGHKRSRLHVNWACLPCTARRQQHTHTHKRTHTEARTQTIRTHTQHCTPEQLLPQQSPLCSFNRMACLARQQQGPRRETDTQKVTQQTNTHIAEDWL